PTTPATRGGFLIPKGAPDDRHTNLHRLRPWPDPRETLERRRQWRPSAVATRGAGSPRRSWEVRPLSQEDAAPATVDRGHPARSVAPLRRLWLADDPVRGVEDRDPRPARRVGRKGRAEGLERSPMHPVL